MSCISVHFLRTLPVVILLLLPSSLGQSGIKTSYKYTDCSDCGVCQERPRPICGTDGVTYFNPCHLGCEKSCNARSRSHGLRPAYEGPCYREPEPQAAAPAVPEPEYQYTREQEPPQQPQIQRQPNNRFHVFRP